MTEQQSTAITKPFDIVTKVTKTVRGYVEGRELMLPTNYSVENALKSAYLKLQEARTKDNQPILSACTQASIADSLLYMAVQGLDPSKNQCYFIAYGQKCTCQRSYFGTAAITKRVVPGVAEIFAEVVYKGDEFEYEINKGRKRISKHVQKLDNIDKDNIVAAYAVLEYNDGRPEECEIMTFDQIKRAWKKSPVKPILEDGSIRPGSTHADYPDRMSRRTIINRLCVPKIYESSDDHLFIDAFRKMEDAAIEAEVELEIEENANSEYIDVTTGEIVDPVDTAINGADDTAGEPETAQASTQAAQAGGNGQRKAPF